MACIFWENNPTKSYSLGRGERKAGHLMTCNLFGAIIDLGRCLDLL